jgi:hypothetical protein
MTFIISSDISKATVFWVALEVLVILRPMGIWGPQKINFSIPNASAVLKRPPILMALHTPSATRVTEKFLVLNRMLS